MQYCPKVKYLYPSSVPLLFVFLLEVWFLETICITSYAIAIPNPNIKEFFKFVLEGPFLGTDGPYLDIFHEHMSVSLQSLSTLSQALSLNDLDIKDFQTTISTATLSLVSSPPSTMSVTLRIMYNHHVRVSIIITITLRHVITLMTKAFHGAFFTPPPATNTFTTYHAHYHHHPPFSPSLASVL